jgi:hypothetical protein
MVFHLARKTFSEEKGTRQRQARACQLKKDDSCPDTCALNHDHAKPHCRMSQGLYYFEHDPQRTICKIQSEGGRVMAFEKLTNKGQEGVKLCVLRILLQDRSNGVTSRQTSRGSAGNQSHSIPWHDIRRNGTGRSTSGLSSRSCIACHFQRPSRSCSRRFETA